MPTLEQPSPRKKVNEQSWFEILRSARVLQSAGKMTWTAKDLVEAAGLEGTQVSTPVAGGKMQTTGASAQQHAAGWLSKFKKWGYVEIVDRRPTGGPVPANVYSLTEKGLTIEQTDSLKNKLSQEKDRVALLAGALRSFIATIGTKEQGRTWETVLRTLDQVDPEHAPPPEAPKGRKK